MRLGRRISQASSQTPRLTLATAADTFGAEPKTRRQRMSPDTARQGIPRPAEPTAGTAGVISRTDHRYAPEHRAEIGMAVPEAPWRSLGSAPSTGYLR